MGKREIHFCEKCGHPTKREIPEGDTHERDVCPSCGYIAYINPINIVGTVPYLGDKVLLCRRAIEPSSDTGHFPRVTRRFRKQHAKALREKPRKKPESMRRFLLRPTFFWILHTLISFI